MKKPWLYVGNTDTRMAPVVSGLKALTSISTSHAITDTYISIYTVSKKLPAYFGRLAHVECNGDESELQECISDLRTKQCLHAGAITKCHRCK